MQGDSFDVVADLVSRLSVHNPLGGNGRPFQAVASPGRWVMRYAAAVPGRGTYHVCYSPPRGSEPEWIQTGLTPPGSIGGEGTAWNGRLTRGLEDGKERFVRRIEADLRRCMPEVGIGPVVHPPAPVQVDF